ncbi:MAG: hypothetical protein M3135_00510 [Actinomycetota bacterium]|nr:hypothetical protein [Actinomycetota bacterium]
MKENEIPDEDRQEQDEQRAGNPRQGPPPDANEADVQEQGELRPPATEPEGESLPDEPAGESLEERVDKAARERSGDEPA